MRLELRQTVKGLFDAGFTLFEDKKLLGCFSLLGEPFQPDGIIRGGFMSTPLTLSPENYKSAGHRIFRPYSIAVGKNPAGHIYSEVLKEGLFKNHSFTSMKLGSLSCEMYPLGFGNEGAKNPVYINGRQTALIKKDCIVHDGLHCWEILAEDETAAVVSLLFCLYGYVCICYRPGEKVTSSVQKSVTVTKDRWLLSKYNSDFEKQF